MQEKFDQYINPNPFDSKISSFLLHTQEDSDFFKLETCILKDLSLREQKNALREFMINSTAGQICLHSDCTKLIYHYTEEYGYEDLWNDNLWNDNLWNDNLWNDNLWNDQDSNVPSRLGNEMGMKDFIKAVIRNCRQNLNKIALNEKVNIHSYSTYDGCNFCGLYPLYSKELLYKVVTNRNFDDAHEMIMFAFYQMNPYLKEDLAVIKKCWGHMTYKNNGYTIDLGSVATGCVWDLLEVLNHWKSLGYQLDNEIYTILQDNKVFQHEEFNDIRNDYLDHLLQPIEHLFHERGLLKMVKSYL